MTDYLVLHCVVGSSPFCLLQGSLVCCRIFVDLSRYALSMLLERIGSLPFSPTGLTADVSRTLGLCDFILLPESILWLCSLCRTAVLSAMWSLSAAALAHESTYLRIRFFSFFCGWRSRQGFLLTCISYPESDVHFAVVDEEDLP